MNDPARVPLSKAEQDALVVKNMPLVHHYAKQAHNSLEYEDRVSEGALGLIRAAADFDPANGCSFGTYASWWIKAFIFRAVNNNLGARSSRTAKIYTGLRRVIHEAELLGIEPSNEYVAKRLDVTADMVAKIRGHVLMGMVRIDSMGMERKRSEEQGGDYWLTRFGLVNYDSPELHAIDRNEQATKAASIRIVMRGLKHREREVVMRRYLCDEGETLQEIGTDWGVSRERVRQVEADALAKIRRGLERLRKVAK